MNASSEVHNHHGKWRILIADDHPIVRQGLAALITHEADMEVCGGAESVADALSQVDSVHPDLVVVDISLKDSHGIDLITQIKARDQGIKMLVWSMFDEKLFAERCLRAGAMGYVNKQESIDQVVDAIRRVLQGEIYLSSPMTSRLLHRVSGHNLMEQDPIENLSNRELQVLEMIGQGMTTRQIARKLSLSPKTVETHREKIKTKLNLKNAAELGRRAVQWVLEKR
ncbi:MAG: response regulator transcription factor [Planctomycetota bacterium]|jgi:DNA-binding NarL/FixJ family response regulator